MMLAPAFAMPNPDNYPPGAYSDPSAPYNQPDYPETWEVDGREWNAHNESWPVFLERLYEHGFPDDYPVDHRSWVVVKRAAAEAEAARCGYELTPGDVLVFITMPSEPDKRLDWQAPGMNADVWPDCIPLDDIEGYATHIQVKMRLVTGAAWRKKVVK